MSILDRIRRPKIEESAILIPVGDHREFAKRRDKSFKEVDLETWKLRLETRVDYLERENKRLKKYESLINSLFERLSHDEEFSRKFKRFVETNQPDMIVKKVEYRNE